MDLPHIERLASVQEDVVRKSENDIKQLEKFADEYRALKEQMSTLPDRVSYDIMVPFGSVAFMPGKLVHTNEIRVLLGDDWFVDRSAKQAIEIIDRRLQIVDEDIADLKKHRDIFKPHLDFTKEFREQAQQEAQIVEKYDEDEEKAWRAQHRLNVKKYYEEQRAARDAEKQKDEEEAYWKRMEEEEERENEELDTQSSSSVESAQLCKSETDCDNSRETFLPKTDTEILSDPAETKSTPDNCRAPSKCESANAVAKKNARKSVRWQDIVQKEEAEDDEEEEEETSSDDSEEYVELCRPTTINFVHTPSTNVVQPVEGSKSTAVEGSRSTAVEGSRSTEGSTTESGVRLILSPADIGSVPVFTPPKSILKKRGSTEENSSQQPSPAVTHKASSQRVQKSSSHSQTARDVLPPPVRQPPPPPSTTFPVVRVVERDTSSPKKTSDSNVSSADISSSVDGNKRISKFKASRSKKTPNA